MAFIYFVIGAMFGALGMSIFAVRSYEKGLEDGEKAWEQSEK